MEKVMYAALLPTRVEDEYYWDECIDIAEGGSCRGDVSRYVQTLDQVGEIRYVDSYGWRECYILNLPHDAMLVYKGDVPVGMYWIEERDPNVWYAVMLDDEDEDWGSEDISKAKAIARAAKYPEGYVAVIDDQANYCLGTIKGSAIERPEL